MRLKLMVPTETLVDEPVEKIVAEAENGSFCLLPRHVDFVAALAPGLLTFVDASGHEGFLAVDEGTLVKRGDEVLVSVRHAVRSDALEGLRGALHEQFENLDEQERAARTALLRLEADAVRRFIELAGERS